MCGSFLDVPDNVALKVARIVAPTKKMGIQVRWIDKVIREISAKRDNFELLCEARLLRIQFEDI